MSIHLSSQEAQLLEMSKRNYGGFHLGTRWYFRDWDPLPYQYVWHHVPVGNTTVVAGIASGKAQPLSSRVLTIRGWREMGDLLPGNLVIAADGSPARVLGIFPQGKRPVYKLTTNDGEVIRADADHLWAVQRRAGRPYTTMTTLQIRDGLQCYGTGGGSGYFLPFTGVAQFEERPIPVDPYLLGLLLGDGGLTRGCVIFTTADNQLLEYVASGIEKYNLAPVHRSQYDYALTGSHHGHSEPGEHRNPLLRDLSLLGVLGKTSHDKFIPPAYIYNAPDVRIAILQGLFDTDGTPARCGVDYATTSSRLAYDVQEIVHSLGGHADISLRYTKANGREFPSYRVYITFRGSWPFAPFRLERKQSRLTPIASSGSGCFRKHIVSVEPDGEEETQCILIDHPDHLYITDGWTPTHNTTMVSASYTMDCLTYPGFRALNASVTAKQAELAFAMVDGWREGNPRFEKFIKDISLRPYPEITFHNGSQFTFRTAGQGAKFIRGFEYDRINYDEPQLDPTDEAVRVLRGRLRGRRPDGSARMARLDCTGTPSYAMWIRERFYKGLRGSEYATPQTLKYYWSLRIETYDNIRLTPEQIALMEADYPPELIDVELRGMWPDYGLSMFPISHINACTDANLNDEMDEATHTESGTKKSGYDIIEWPRVGEIKMEFPFDPRRVYVIAGDPGVDTPPKRNAGVVMVADVTDFPHKKLVYFHWVPGQGSYHPFLNSYKYAMQKYRPILHGIDATGPQKALDELGFEDYGLVLDNLNFGALKDGMLNTLLVDVTSHTWQWPRIQGLIQQFSTYRREDDKPAKQIPQDLIMTLAQISWLARSAPTGERQTGTPKPNYRHRRQRASVSSMRR